MAKILLVHHVNNSFIDTDRKILEKYYDVEDFKYEGIKSIPALIKASKNCDVIVSWFMSLHTLPTTLTKTPKVYIAGGYDAANVPEIKYGMANRFYTKWIVKRCLNKADKVLSVSKHNKADLKKNYGYYDSETIYNTISDKIYRTKTRKDSNKILTVGAVNKETLSRKGIRDFCRLAEYCHKQGDNFKFVVVGKIDPNVMSEVEKWCMKTPNLLFTDWIEDDKLLWHFNRAKVYCQLSKYESFGVSLLEAMKCECIPIINPVAALPEVAQGHGYYAHPKDLPEARNKLYQASKNRHGKRIAMSTDYFSLDKREKALKAIIDELVV